MNLKMPKKSFIFNTVISITCGAFVVWQSVKCVGKLLAAPQGTHVQVKDTASEPRLSITICYNDLNVAYADTLASCNLTLHQYFYEGIWIGHGQSYCSDPKDLYNQLNSNIQLSNITENVGVLTKQKLFFENSVLSVKEGFHNGKCFSLKASHLAGVKALGFKTSSDHDVYLVFHSPQLYFTQNEYEDKIVKRNTTVNMKIDYYVQKVLDYEGKPCKHYGKSTQDECLLKATDQVLLNKVGCTTPFSRDKSNICTQPADAMKAQLLQDKYLYKEPLENECPRSCTNLKSQITSDTTIDDGTGYSRINLPEHIQVYESYYTYDGLSMVAEIGGYVGLFLGISVNQIGLLFEKLFLYYE